MIYQQIKFGCKKISSSADMVETVIFDQMSPSCDPELEDSKPVFLHDTLAHNAASSYQVWLQKIQQLRRYPPDEYSLEFWTFSVTLTRTTTEQSNLFTRQSTLWWCTSNQVSCKRMSSSDNISKRYILIILSLTVTLTLKTANQSFWVTIWLMMMHHLTKFCSKRFSNSEDIIWKNIDILKFCCDLDFEYNNPISP